MLRVLADHAVAWVLTGSTVLAVHGAEPVPNDLDVTPARDAANLRRLATALGALDAVPAFTPGWRDDFTLDTCRAWRPAPATEQQLEYPFVTRRGLLDVPMRMCGSYEQLVPTASRVVLAGVPVLVCDPVAVLDRASAQTSPEHRARAALYDTLRHGLAAGGRPGPVALARLVDRLS